MNLSPKFQPELDPDFLPASVWRRAFQAQISEASGRQVAIRVERPQGGGSTYREEFLPAGEEFDARNRLHLERIVKSLLWARGGCRVLVAGADELVGELAERYSDAGKRAFDVEFVRKVYSEELEVKAVAAEALEGLGSSEEEGIRGTDGGGCRIGFDLGGSDRKCAAVVDGKVVFSEEVPWNPYFSTDPEYHRSGIIDSIQRAAAHLPRVDAIGGSVAGVFMDNRVRFASLFRGVPAERFESDVRDMFLDVAKKWDVPFKIANDGDVTALAGSMSVGDGALLGIAMGTSTAAGYVDPNGGIPPWLSELAFVPIDYRPDGPVDEWSGDRGCCVQYFSQQAVSRLIPASGLEIDGGLPQPEQLVEVQKRMQAGDDRAAAIYRTIGTYLGYAIPQFACFYEIRHLLLLGRVLSGEGGELIVDGARQVLKDEFPEQASLTELFTPDENLKRHGQAIAAASLPELS